MQKKNKYSLKKFCNLLAGRFIEEKNLSALKIKTKKFGNGNYIGICIQLPNSNLNFKDYIPPKMPLRTIREYEIILIFKKNTILDEFFFEETRFGLLVQGAAIQQQQRMEKCK